MISFPQKSTNKHKEETKLLKIFILQRKENGD
jgi:hypothetical protein